LPCSCIDVHQGLSKNTAPDERGIFLASAGSKQAEQIDFVLTVASTSARSESLLHPMGRAYFWQRLLDTGAVADKPQIVKREGVHKNKVFDMLRLAPVSPDIALASSMCGTEHTEVAFHDQMPSTKMGSAFQRS
jgi:hypothetical protein